MASNAADKRSWRQRARDKLFAIYGDHCVCCGETLTKLLTFAHRSGGGAEHRRRVAHTTGSGAFKSTPNYDRYYKDLLENFNEDIEIQCQNCNWGAHVNGGICPHKELLTNALAGGIVSLEERTSGGETADTPV